MQTIIETLAQFASELQYGQLSPAVVDKAKVCVLDLLGIAVAGSCRDNWKVALKTASRLGSSGNATVWMTSNAARAIDAVLPNSVAAHCILQDDWLQVSHSHIGAAVIPTAIAVCEEERRSGRELIASIVAAYDVEDRAGYLAVPAFTRGFRASSVYSYFGAAAAAGTLMRLDKEQMANALGCAGSLCGGVLQPWNEGSMEWSFQEAFGSRAGILAAVLAAQGLAGSKNIFEGAHGLNKSYSGTNDGQETALDKLGSRFHIMDTCFKRFATGGANHGSGAVAFELRKRHGIDHRRIRRVRVDIPRTGTHERMDYAGIPYRGPYHTIDQCLISKPFAIASILIEGNLTFDTVRRLQHDPDLLNLAGKIELKEVGDIDGWNLKMAVEMDDGSVFQGDGTYIDQSHLYLSWDAATAKFRTLTENTLGRRRAGEIIDLIGKMEHLDGIEPVTERLAPKPKKTRAREGKSR
ncbi:MAG: MmgE/PrpD family protein [Betaproteobacteria bacterium]|nr:MmgE/PrpD family protein [Betaproteobacteria bacterium]